MVLRCIAVCALSCALLWSCCVANEEWVASFRPQNCTAHPRGFWVGTQSLACVVRRWTPRIRLTRRAPPTRSTITLRHSLLYYRGFFFEWGMGPRTYHIGRVPAATRCPIRWERRPAETSRCRVNALADYARNYSREFGPYNVVANNCHHFVNRAMEMLVADGCHGPAGESSMWKRFYSLLPYHLRFDSGTMYVERHPHV